MFHQLLRSELRILLLLNQFRQLRQGIAVLVPFSLGPQPRTASLTVKDARTGRGPSGRYNAAHPHAAQVVTFESPDLVVEARKVGAL